MRPIEEYRALMTAYHKAYPGNSSTYWRSSRKRKIRVLTLTPLFRAFRDGWDEEREIRTKEVKE